MAFKKGQSGNLNGRPKGTLTKPRLSDYLSEEQVKVLVNKAIEMASTGDSVMLKFCLEQHFGRAAQPISNDDDKPFKISGVEISVRKDEDKI